ncbi:hypothetical protein [Trinickia dinghuensis]|uniref:Uncharacterized protein n=1 Tax=Trinickia dinghuensis TaxID=2291023 RepID=A0A3D8K5X4_9BURK|nr:hypothetical protein [Trinickia dinghuensis]RDV00443.1 hypothetical protein DWV00_01235 [Trinickia dinghuensis]
MSVHLRGIGLSSVPVDDSASSQNTQGPFGPQGHHHPHHHVHQGGKSGARSRSKRRRGADSPDGVDESAASEELQMMLNEHLQKQSEFVMRVAERHPGDRGGSGGDGRDGRDNDDGAIWRPAKRLSAGKRFQRGMDGAYDAEQAHEAAESALLHAREAQAQAHPQMSSTYAVLAAMRDFLALPSAAAHASGTLAAVRQRLIEAVGTPAKRAPVQQQSINLLLPLMLLNLERARTDTERALAVAKLNSLLDRRRSYV